MMKGTMSLELRTFDELTPEEKTKLIDKIRYREVEDCSWSEFITDDFTNELKENGWFVLKNGVGWYADRGKIAFDGVLNIDTFCELHIKDWLPKHDGGRTGQQQFKKQSEQINVKSVRDRDGWNCRLDIDDPVVEEDFDGSDAMRKDSFKKFQLQWEKIKDEIEFFYDEILKKFGKEMEEQYEYLQSDEYIIERYHDDGGYFDNELEWYSEKEFDTLKEVKP
jgi:hypothetical protein